MNSFHLFLSRLRAFFRRRQFESEMAAEMQHHLAERTDDNVADGLSPDAARQAALRKFGNVGLLQERTRDELRWLWLEQLLQDLRFAARSLWKNPGFTSFAL